MKGKNNLKMYITIIEGMLENLESLRNIINTNKVRVNRKLINDTQVSNLINKIREFIDTYTGDDAKPDEYTAPRLNELMDEYREVTAPFVITNKEIKPRTGTTIRAK